MYDPNKPILDAYFTLLKKAYPSLKGDHQDWDTWAATAIEDERFEPDTNNIYGRAKGFLSCITRFTDLRISEDEIYDPRFQRAKIRSEFCALAIIIRYGDPTKAKSGIKALKDCVDTAFEEPTK